MTRRRHRVHEVGRHPEPPPERRIGDRFRGRFQTDGSERVVAEGVTVEDADFSGSRFWSLWVTDSAFVRCDFSEAKLGAAMLGWTGSRGRSVYRECVFDHADLRAPATSTGPLGRARFERCTFDGARIHGWFSFEAEFVECRFSGQITECTFHGRPLDEERPFLDRLLGRVRPNEFRGNDFRRCELLHTLFKRGIDVAAQQWPETGEYIRLNRFPERHRRVRSLVSAWPDGDRRREALQLLDRWAFCFEGQESIFARRHEADEPHPPVLVEELWAALETA